MILASIICPAPAPTLSDKAVLQQSLLHGLGYRLRTDFPDVVLKLPYGRPIQNGFGVLQSTETLITHSL